jgi:hypothetical protein
MAHQTLKQVVLVEDKLIKQVEVQMNQEQQEIHLLLPHLKEIQEANTLVVLLVAVVV